MYDGPTFLCYTEVWRVTVVVIIYMLKTVTIYSIVSGLYPATADVIIIFGLVNN